MGVYALSDVRANGAPRFVKRLAGGGAHYLFRQSNGNWMATDDESNIAKNVGAILSSRAADLPSKAGLGWQYADNGAWPDDPNLRCTEVTGPAAAPSRRARGGGGGRGEREGRGEEREGRPTGRRTTQPTRRLRPTSFHPLPDLALLLRPRSRRTRPMGTTHTPTLPLA